MTALKILVLSDSHRYMQHMYDAVDKEKPDHVIHLGDHLQDAEDLSRMYPMLPVLCIRGNCDFDPTGRDQAIIELGGIRIMAVHGHRYGVKSGLLQYTYAAKESMVDVALFGHTHHAVCDVYQDTWFLNPGSCGYCSRPSYGLIEIQNKKAACRLVDCEDRG